MYGYIYKIENNLNKKFYIGKHKAQKFDKNYYGSGLAIMEAVNKYGKDNFSIIVLDTAESLDELNQKEKDWIQKLDAINLGYNIAPGGDGGEVWGSPENHPSKRTDRMGERNPFYGKHHSQEVIDKLKAIWAQRKAEGKMPKNGVKGKLRVHKDDLPVKYILPEELDTYLAQGWTHYHLPEKKPKIKKQAKTHGSKTGWHQSDYQKQRASEVHKGKKLSQEVIQKIKDTKAAKSEEEKALIRKHMSESHKGKESLHKGYKFVHKYINDEKIQKLVKLEELESYIKNGWFKGLGPKPKK